MSLWYESLGLCLDDYGEDTKERTKCIFAHLSMDVPRSWWEHALQTGNVPASYVHILQDLHEELLKTFKSTEDIGFGLLVALAFIDDDTDQQKPKFGTVDSECSIEQYLAKAKAKLAKRPELGLLGQVIDKQIKKRGQNMSFDKLKIDNSSKSIDKILSSIESSKGRSTGWPNCFDYNFDFNNNSCVISLKDKHSKQNFRKFDPWALAFFTEVENEMEPGVKQIVFEIKNLDKERDTSFAFSKEAFKRRVSFLALNNQEIKFEIRIEDETLQLYDNTKQLFDRPKEEIIHENLHEPIDDDKIGRLEKDFQTWLFGQGKSVSSEVTNERLAVLGADFFNLKRKGLKIYREFTTGVFREKIARANRILPTDYIDIITFNKNNNLSVIELKLNDSKLDVISQILDYALFFRCYRDQLLPLLEKHFSLNKIRNDNIICYVANNYFHPRLKEIIHFYSTKEKATALS